MNKYDNKYDKAFYIGLELKKELKKKGKEINRGFLIILLNLLKNQQIDDFRNKILRLFMEVQKEVPEDFFLNIEWDTGQCFVSGLWGKEE